MQYDLQRLGAARFQDLAAALAIAVCGTHIQSLGSGRDGGRDMYCEGVINCAPGAGTSAETWNGYTVFQVKHKERLDAQPKDNAAWLWNAIRDELYDWSIAKTGRQRMPDYLVFITNVPLTPDPVDGGLVTINTNIRNYIDNLSDGTWDTDDQATAERKERWARLRRIKSWRIWDGNQVSAYIDVHDGVRRGFSGLITPGDVLATLAQFTDQLPIEELEPALRRHARAALISERKLHFDEAGAVDGTGIPIEQVVIDLPLANPPQGAAETALGFMFDRAERVLKPSFGFVDGPTHIVLTGSPGNGKSTLSKFLVHAHRAAFINADDGLDEMGRATVEGTEAAMKNFGRQGLPPNRRWPTRIDLAQYAEEKGLSEDSNLLRWIAHKISRTLTDGNVTPNMLHAWMMQWPWLLVLDGLDEVTEPATRKRLIGQIEALVSEAAADNCDLLVVLTTRPTGFVEKIAPTHFERVDLGPLAPYDAVRYGIAVTQLRLQDEGKVDRVTRELHKASNDDALRNLLQTPLQVLIMTIIAETSGGLAPDRFTLFWTYYNSVYSRERGKLGRFAKLLQDHSPHILQLHQRVGFQLQCNAENAVGASSVVTPDELRNTAWRVLHDAGYDPGVADAGILQQILEAATNRLVLLVPRDHGFGFDVRSLQELMAARKIGDGAIDEVRARLRLVLPSPHWRNTWVFAAGRSFHEPLPQNHEMIVDLVETADTRSAYRLSATFPVAPQVALELLADGMARSYPNLRRRLLSVALSAFGDIINDIQLAARALLNAASAGDLITVRDSLRQALRGTRRERVSAEAIIKHIAVLARTMAVAHDVAQLGALGLSITATQADPPVPEPSTERLVDALSAEEGERFATALQALSQLASNAATPEILATLRTGLEDPAVAEALDDLLSRDTEFVHERVLLSAMVLAEVVRRPVGPELTALIG